MSDSTTPSALAAEPRDLSASGATRAEPLLVLFTKPDIPGRVKTRLIGTRLASGGVLDALQAADLHRAFLGDLSERLLSGRFELAVAWAMDGAAERSLESLTETLGVPMNLGWKQEGGSLGERLFEGLQRASSRSDRVGAVGSDHPDLDFELIESGFERLNDVDVVLGPADDGGYYFIGLRARTLCPRLFDDIRWSTQWVLEETLERCRELGLSVELLETGFDVDDAEGLERLSRRLADSDRCPRTVQRLNELGFLPVLENHESAR